MSTAFTIWLVLAGTLGLVWFIRFVAIGFTLRARLILDSRDYADGPTIHSAIDSAEDSVPRVSVIVAAKDEEGDIETCVTTLLDQDYPNFEVIAVDDRSSDRTPAILHRLAEQHADRLRVITISELREGWFGKNNAMRAGVEASTGEWLLFTDADCRQTSRRTLSVAVSEARHHECDFLCITPVLDTHAAWERILQPVCALVLIIWFLPQRVNNPKKKTAYANGAFMLMRRSCYDAIGGHERVRTEVNEDIHLARFTKAAGLKLRVVENDDLYRTRMYATPKEAWRGWSRIFYGSLGSWRRLTIAIFALLFFSLQPWISLVVALINVGLSDAGLSDVELSAATSPWTWAAAAWGGVVFFEQLVMWRFYGVLKMRRAWSFTYPLGCVVTFGILINAILKALGAATTTWRGTTYHGDRVAHARAAPPATETQDTGRQYRTVPRSRYDYGKVQRGRRKSDMRQRVSLVITDLDDTLWDWVHIWYSSFKPMLDSIARTTGIRASDLEREFRDVHRRHGTSEYAFAIEELPSLRALYPNDDLTVVFQDAIGEFRKGRREAMMLFPSVRDTLSQLKRAGCMIVGYTDSMEFYAHYRIRNLGLDGLLDYVYSPPDHDLPDGAVRSEIRRYRPEHYRLNHTDTRFVPKGQVKPNPLVLLSIVSDLFGTPRETIYVGDKLRHDIAMANSASVASVWAQYGARTDNEEYNLLRRVSHWSPAMIEKEKQTTVEAVEPDFVLSERFGELLELFDFRPFQSATACADKLDTLAHAVDAWKTTVTVQMHFNDLELRIRNYAITLLLGVLTLSGFAMRADFQVDLLGVSVPLAALLIGGGLLAWTAFYFMDCHWYHNLLYGAVEHGKWIEDQLSNVLPELGLTKSIGKASPTQWLGFRIHSKTKVRLFYGAIGVFLVVLIALLFLGHSPEGKKKPEGNGKPVAVAPQPDNRPLQSSATDQSANRRGPSAGSEKGNRRSVEQE